MALGLLHNRFTSGPFILPENNHVIRYTNGCNLLQANPGNEMAFAHTGGGYHNCLFCCASGEGKKKSSVRAN